MAEVTAVLSQIRVAGSLIDAMDSFLLDRVSRNLSAGTIRYYSSELSLFQKFLDQQGVGEVEAVSGDDVRTYLAEVARRRNPRGVHASFRAVRAFFKWYEREAQPEGWRNPLANIRGPRVSKSPLPGVSEDTIRMMLGVCRGENGVRDKAILNLLYSSGLRAGELVALNVGHVNLTTGAVWVAAGKGNKSRQAGCCQETRRLIRSMLRDRGQVGPGDPLFIARSGERLTYAGLVHVLRGRAERAGVEPPGAHDFRRAYAVASLRNGENLANLAQLMGHTSLEVLRTYLHLVTTDIERGYAKYGPSLGGKR